MNTIIHLDMDLLDIQSSQGSQRQYFYGYTYKLKFIMQEVLSHRE